MSKQQGFTLVELAIVFLIIGILLGAVLKGQEMVNNARIKRAVSDFDGVAAAIFSYQDRYNRLPGDDPGANARWTLATPGCDGDANGSIDGLWNVGPDNCSGTAMTGANESLLMWFHLRRSGLITGKTIITDDESFAQPSNPFGGIIGVQDGAPLAGIQGHVVCMSRVLGKFGGVIDSQVDDGAGDSGILQQEIAAATPAYVEGTEYIICRQL
ncbi:MAG: prepilin-type N-terminal cleavage/methylation domain-containing protein [Gammaproteobacteria bacterium]|nr:MAG: prepilin-type N-terminal cleavage/methylation domain-containing protein [Gammaproteobacteria bacterium]